MERLAARHEMFVRHLVRLAGEEDAQPKAYEAAFGPSEHAGVLSRRLLGRGDITRRWQELLAEASPGVPTIGRIFERLALIAFADPNELIALRVGCCRYCHGDGFGYQWREREYAQALGVSEANGAALPDVLGGFGYMPHEHPNPDCPECGGEGLQRVVPRDSAYLSDAGVALFAGVKQTRDGLEIKMHDQLKAIELAGRILGAFNDKIRLDLTGGAAKALASLPTDPNEAARAYQEMVKRTAANAA